MVKTVSIHSYEPSPNVVARTYDADIFIYHSNILESGLADLAPQLRKKGSTCFRGSCSFAIRKGAESGKSSLKERHVRKCAQ